MKIVTLLQFGFKLLSIPFIFAFVQNENDVWKFALLVSLSSIFSSILASFHIYTKEKIIITLQSLNEVKMWFKEALPYFMTNNLNTIKQNGTILIIGSFFSMREVALYDLAMKIFSIPTVLTSSINLALFPKIILNYNYKKIQKIIKLEFLIGLTIIVFLILTGKLIIKILAGNDMLEAYSLLVILSFNVFTPLIVGIYAYFIFVPKGMSNIIFRNQLIAFIIFIIMILLSLAFYPKIIMIPIAMLVSGIAEIIYCKYQINKMGDI